MWAWDAAICCSDQAGSGGHQTGNLCNSSDHPPSLCCEQRPPNSHLPQEEEVTVTVRQSFHEVLLHFHTPETVDLRESLDQNLQTGSFQDKLSLERCFVLTCGIFF